MAERDRVSGDDQPMPKSDAPWLAERFEENRPHLRAVALRMLGSPTEAEDAVQDAWLRLNRANTAEVENLGGWLTTVVARLCLDRLRARAARRESSMDAGAGDPVVTLADEEPGPEDEAVLADSVGLAMLVVLETLSPLERAVFVLREVFGMSHEEVAATLDRSPASVRQLAHRAREHVQARRPRFDADTDEQRRVTQEFLQACFTGDLDRLLGLLAPDVILTSDGGGKRQAALRPIVGSEKVGRFMVAVSQGGAEGAEIRFESINGQIGIVARKDGEAHYVGLLGVTDGRISEILIIANPDKLAHLTSAT
jgi:RNA polymerase sigma-70 factor, ECF subfamily